MNDIHEVLLIFFVFSLLIEELLKKYLLFNSQKGVIIGQQNLMFPNTLVLTQKIVTFRITIFFEHLSR